MKELIRKYNTLGALDGSAIADCGLRIAESITRSIWYPLPPANLRSTRLLDYTYPRFGPEGGIVSHRCLAAGTID